MSELNLSAIEKLLGVKIEVSYYDNNEGGEWIAEFKKGSKSLSFCDNNAPVTAHHPNNPSLAVIQLCHNTQGQSCSYGGSMNNPHGEIVTFPDMIDHGIKF